MKFTGFMPTGVELHGGFDQFHVERYSSWEYGDGSVDKIACFVSIRILAWTPLTFVKKTGYEHIYLWPQDCGKAETVRLLKLVDH